MASTRYHLGGIMYPRGPGAAKDEAQICHDNASVMRVFASTHY